MLASCGEFKIEVGESVLSNGFQIAIKLVHFNLTCFILFCNSIVVQLAEAHSRAPGRPGEQRSYGEDAIWWNTKSSSWIHIYFMICMYFVIVILYFCDFGGVVYAYDLAFPEGIVKGNIFYSNKKSLL